MTRNGKKPKTQKKTKANIILGEVQQKKTFFREEAIHIVYSQLSYKLRFFD